MDIKVLSKWVLYFLNNSDYRVSKSKINNLLCYISTLYQRVQKEDVLKGKFRVSYKGFELEGLENALFEMEKLELIGVRYNAYGIYLVPLVTLEEDVYSKGEAIVLNRINKNLNSLSSSSLIAYSCNQFAWKNSNINDLANLDSISLACLA